MAFCSTFKLLTSSVLTYFLCLLPSRTESVSIIFRKIKARSLFHETRYTRGKGLEILNAPTVIATASSKILT